MTYDDKLRQQIKDELLNLDELDQHNIQFSEQIIAETDCKLMEKLFPSIPSVEEIHNSS